MRFVLVLLALMAACSRVKDQGAKPMVTIEGRIREVGEVDLSKTLSAKNIYTELELDVERVEPADKQSGLRPDTVFSMHGRAQEPLQAGMRVQIDVDPLSWSDRRIRILGLRVLR